MIRKSFRICFVAFLFIFQLQPAVGAENSDTAMCIRLFDYENSKDRQASWRTVNDNVMGGRSVGTYVINDTHLRFSGFINTNGGGFASIRHTVPALPFFGLESIRMSVRSDGRSYTLSLADEFCVRRGVSHRVALNAPASDEFMEVELPASDLVPMFRGRVVQAPPLDTNKIQEIRIMLSDSIDGDFRLDIAWIDVCRF